MDIILFNLSWMSFNIFLAVIPIVAALLMLKTRNIIVQFFLGFIWLIFLPNSIYMITDIIHIFDTNQQTTDPFVQVIIFIQYVLIFVLGIVTFVFSLHPFEKLLRRKKINPTLWLYGVNFLVGFGVVLGRIQRLNSWDVFTNFPQVVANTFSVVTTPSLFGLALLFGLLANIFYFSCKKFLLKEAFDLEKI